MNLNLLWRLLEANLAFLPRRHFGVLQFDDRNYSWRGREPGQPWFERQSFTNHDGTSEYTWCFGDMQITWTEPEHYRRLSAERRQLG